MSRPKSGEPTISIHRCVLAFCMGITASELRRKIAELSAPSKTDFRYRRALPFWIYRMLGVNAQTILEDGEKIALGAGEMHKLYSCGHCVTRGKPCSTHAGQYRLLTSEIKDKVGASWNRTKAQLKNQQKLD